MSRLKINRSILLCSNSRRKTFRVRRAAAAILVVAILTNRRFCFRDMSILHWLPTAGRQRLPAHIMPVIRSVPPMTETAREQVGVRERAVGTMPPIMLFPIGWKSVLISHAPSRRYLFIPCRIIIKIQSSRHFPRHLRNTASQIFRCSIGTVRVGQRFRR